MILRADATLLRHPLLGFADAILHYRIVRSCKRSCWVKERRDIWINTMNGYLNL